MLTKIDNPRVSYFARIMVLPLAILVFAAFSLKPKINAFKAVTSFSIESNITDKAATALLIDSLFKSIPRFKNTKDTFPKNIRENDTTGKKPIYILNGTEIDEKNFSSISPNDIESINVLKDKDAIQKYGDKAKNGVVEILLKKDRIVVSESKNPELMSDSIIYVYGFTYKGRLGWKINDVVIPNNALYILNGKEAREEIAAKIADKDVADITVLKGGEATKSYGSKALNGVVIINTKPGYEIRIWKADTLKFYRNAKLSPVNKKMLVIVNNKFYYDKTLQQVADELGIIQFETIFFLPPEKAIAKYGEMAKDGAVLVTLKNIKESVFSENSDDVNIAIQEPKIYLGNSTGGKINLEYLKTINEVNVSGGIAFVSGTLYISGPGFDKNVLQIQLRTASLSNVQTSFSRCKNGAQLVFDAVRVKDRNGDERTLQSTMPFIVYDKNTEISESAIIKN